MGVFFRFLFDFMSQLFDGIWNIIKGFATGIAKIFDIPAYITVIKDYSGEFGISQWILAIVAIIVVIALMVLIIFLGFLLFKKYFRLRKSLVEQEDMLEEIGKLYGVTKECIRQTENRAIKKIQDLNKNINLLQLNYQSQSISLLVKN